MEMMAVFHTAAWAEGYKLYASKVTDTTVSIPVDGGKANIDIIICRPNSLPEKN